MQEKQQGTRKKCAALAARNDARVYARKVAMKLAKMYERKGARNDVRMYESKVATNYATKYERKYQGTRKEGIQKVARIQERKYA